jgi:hypothetical protein
LEEKGGIRFSLRSRQTGRHAPRVQLSFRRTTRTSSLLGEKRSLCVPLRARSPSLALNFQCRYALTTRKKNNIYIVFCYNASGAFCIDNAPILSVATLTVLVAAGLCPVATGSVWVATESV